MCLVLPVLHFPTQHTICSSLWVPVGIEHNHAVVVVSVDIPLLTYTRQLMTTVLLHLLLVILLIELSLSVVHLHHFPSHFADFLPHSCLAYQLSDL